MQDSIKRIRTIALVGQAGSGKTTLAERLLAKAGAVHAAGSVERGTTVCDYAPGEKQLQHSLKLAVASFDAKVDDESAHVHLLDTPGYPDFAGHALPALAAVSAHRGQINGSDSPRPGLLQISAQAPLSELEQFPARLKSITAGRGSYNLEFSHYESAPPLLQQKLQAAHKPQAEAD